MKKIIFVLILTMFSSIGYIIATPYLTVFTIRDAIIEEDADKLSTTIEFPVLRKNVTKQLEEPVMKQVARALGDNFISLTVSLTIPKILDRLVEEIITPSGLIKLIQGDFPDLSLNPRKEAKPPEPNSQKKQEERENLFNQAEYGYDSINTFFLQVKTKRDEKIRFILERKGLLSWKLVNIILPIPIN